MNCCVCGTKIKDSKECADRWYNGGRVIICTKESCDKTFTKRSQEEFKKNGKVTSKWIPV